MAAMRSMAGPRLLRSAWFYLFIAVATLALVAVVIGSWAYENNSWFRFHVQDVYAQARGLVVKQAETVPTPVNHVAAPTFAPSPTLPPIGHAHGFAHAPAGPPPPRRRRPPPPPPARRCRPR